MTVIFENNKDVEISIELILCPIGDCVDQKGTYDTKNILPNDEIQLNTNCDRICWKHNGSNEWNSVALTKGMTTIKV